jgi:hypothetical protein
MPPVPRSERGRSAPAEEQDDVLVEPEAEREDVGAFEKERALLLGEQWKAGEVRPSRVDLVSAKSVLTVTDARRLLPRRCVRSRLS